MYKKIVPFLAPSETKFLVVVAILIGLVAGLGVFLVDTLISFIFNIGIGRTIDSHSELTLSRHWLVIVLPTLGGLLVPLFYSVCPESKGHGVPEVIKAIYTRGGRIRGRVAIFKGITTALTIGTGGATGREGPIAQIGAAVGSKIAQILKMPTTVIQTLAAAGAASGIAAAFNAPLGGMSFGMEVVLRRFSFHPLAMIVLSTVVAATVSRGFHGRTSYFNVPEYRMGHPAELMLYVLLGIAAGVIAKLFVWVLYKFEDGFDSMTWASNRWRPAIGGFLVGCLGFFLPGVLGTGHHVIILALHNQIPLLVVGLLVFGKLFATSFTLSSGGSGGIFMPTLFIGAMLGSTLGNAFASFIPFVENPGAYATVGMAAVFAAATHAPLTAILLLFEMTYDYAIILPVMSSTVTAVLVSRVLEPETIYTLKLKRDGITLPQESEAPFLENISVEKVMTRNVETLAPSLSLERLTRFIEKSAHTGFPVADKDGRVVGLITYAEIHAAFSSGELPVNGVIVKDLMREKFPMLPPQSSLSEALSQMNLHGVDRVPVVESFNNPKLIGLVTQSDILNIYHKAAKGKV